MNYLKTSINESKIMVKFFVTNLLLTIIIISGGCLPALTPNPPTQQLVLPINIFPETWEMSGAPTAMGPSIGFGDEDDAVARFKLKDEKYNVAMHYIFFYPSENSAIKAYPEGFFNDNSIAVNHPWQIPEELSYESSVADQFRIGCTINNIAGENLVCQIAARYGNYTTIFHSSIREDTITLDQFNGIVKYLDEMMIEKLNIASKS
ncbi:MAG: hypothetical protein OT477_02510 [Chloroflexi bacterium]|nr:hypothetical protein [Chloroflexota bacterium]